MAAIGSESRFPAVTWDHAGAPLANLPAQALELDVASPTLGDTLSVSRVPVFGFLPSRSSERRKGYYPSRSLFRLLRRRVL